jgi:acid phosphatase
MKFLNFLIIFTVTGFCTPQAQSAPPGLQSIEHIVVIYLENRSFDSLFAEFPGANGLLNHKKILPQTDEFGKPYAYLPTIMSNNKVDERFPPQLLNKPYNIAEYVKPEEKHPDLTHRFFINQMQIDAGRNDRFAQLSSAGGLTLGHYNPTETALWRYAKEFTLADNFFQAAFGGSFLNHQWLICACTPEFNDAPVELRQWKNDPNSGLPVSDPTVTKDGFAVGTLQPHYPPFDPSRPDNRLPPQNNPTIGDRLTEKGISWAWYAGGWNDAAAGNKTDENFQYHHQPFVYYSNYAPETPARAAHLKDRSNLLVDIKGDLPQVVFYKPAGNKNQHPGYSTLVDADHEVEEIVETIRNNPAIWPTTAIIITYDEYGGFWDHVAPPQVDRWGPGTRIPAIIISPFAKKGHVDHTQYDTTSILKLIESRFDLKPLTDRDANAKNLLGAFRFKH